jgi:ABC-2 type transport system permease protein
MKPANVLAFAAYEVKRAIARKKVLALVVITIVLDTIPYLALSYAGSSLIPVVNRPFLWVAGVFIPQALFLQFIALLISAGSMSEEYEQGTAEVLLSKPVSRDEYFWGKFGGGFALLCIVVVLNASLSVTTATFTFGPQLGLQILPTVVAAQAFSAILFFSAAFMIGELVRRSSLSYILGAAVFFTSQVAGLYLNLIFRLTGNQFYHAIDLYLPTTPVDSLPTILASPSLPSGAASILEFVGASSVETSVLFSALLIAVYSLVCLAIARTYFNWADVAKRIT